MTGSATPTGSAMPTGELSRRVEALLRARLEAEVRRLVVKTVRRLVERSPVGQGIHAGRFAASWRVGVNQIDVSVSLGGHDEAPTLPEWRLGETIFITNSLWYSLGLEFGHSAQAPSGVVWVTLAELLTGTLSFTERDPQLQAV